MTNFSIERGPDTHATLTYLREARRAAEVAAIFETGKFPNGVVK